MSSLTVLLVGPANSGKTSLFNSLTNSRHKIVNYPGSTVACGLGKISSLSHTVTVIDTPGILSLRARSFDETITLKTLDSVDHLVPTASSYPNLICIVIDATQIKRQLSLVRQIKRLGCPCILALNKSDLIDFEIDASALSVFTNMPVFQTSVKEPSSIQSLAVMMSSYCEETPTIETSIEDCIGNPKEDYIWAESCANTVIIKKKDSLPSFDYDRLLLHPVFAPFIFFGIMLFFFWSIFSLSSPFMDMIDSGFGAIMSGLSGLFPSHVLSELLIDGCIGGIGAFMVFSPQIFILFCVLGMMESSGYLARGAIIMDRPLSLIGLSGRSFVPLLSGCACAIPAMMATRSIPSRKERLVAIFIIPLMSCSARLPVYGLLFALLFSNSSSLYAGLALTSVYAVSVCLASIIGAIASRVIGLKKEFSHFDIELPRLHVPSFKNICIDAFHNTFSFIRNAGPIILFISLILWFLGRFPSSESSFIILLSQWIEPVLRPMGVDGRVGIAILLSFAAREIFVSSLALVFSTQDASSSGFLDTLSQATISGHPLFSTASIVSLVVFFIISMQCMATLAIAKKETGSWYIPGLMMVVYTLLAYFCSVFVYYMMTIL